MRKFTSAILLLAATTTWGGWEPVSRPLLGNFRQLLKLSSGLAALSSGRLYRSTDQGAHWGESRIGLDASVRFQNIASFGDTIVALGNGTVWRSCDAGLSWAKWDDGLSPYRGVESWLLGGDSAFVSVVTYGAVLQTQYRTPNSTWKSGFGAVGGWSNVGWNGRYFVVPSYDLRRAFNPFDSLDNSLNSSDSRFVSGPIPTSAIRDASGTLWGLYGQLLIRSKDRWVTWDSVFRCGKWVYKLAATSSGLIGIGVDTMWLYDPKSNGAARVITQPEKYGFDLVDVDGRWFFLGLHATWMSQDSGRHWVRSGIPGAGMLDRILPTEEGFVIQDGEATNQGLVSKDLVNWAPFAFPSAIVADGIDTSGGMLYAFDANGKDIWVRKAGTWALDSSFIGNRPKNLERTLDTMWLYELERSLDFMERMGGG